MQTTADSQVDICKIAQNVHKEANLSTKNVLEVKTHQKKAKPTSKQGRQPMELLLPEDSLQKP